MNLFAGMVSFDDMPIERGQQDRLIDVIARRGASRPAVQRTARAVFVQAERTSPLRAGVLAVASARLDNRDEMASVLGVDACDASLTLRAFARDGDASLARLNGAFTLAHWDETAARLTLARDCVGESPLFYYAGDGFVIFASHIADLLALTRVPRALDERVLANFLALNHHEQERTFYRDIARVPSRSVVRITAAGSERRHYWSPRLDAPPPYTRVDDYIERARELFDRAVARSLRGAPRAAILLSGGLDSSAVAATAARLGCADIVGYTGVPPAGLNRPPRPGWYLNERGKVETLAGRYPSLRTVFVTPHGAHARQADPTRFFPGLPLAHRNLGNLGWFSQIDDVIAADGHRVVLNGSLGNMTLSWDGRLSLAALLSGGHWWQLLRQARLLARAQRRSLARLLAAEALMPLLPSAVHGVLQRLRGLSPEDVGAISLLHPEIAAALDLRRQWRADGYDPTFSAHGTGARLRAHMIFDHFQLARDMTAMRRATNEIDARDPYADRDLVEFSLAVPETLYRRDGIARAFARRVFADRLPAEILNECRHGEQAPNWFEALDERKETIAQEAERIQGSALASRLIDTDRLKRLIAAWPPNARAAQERMIEYRYALDRAVHLGQFIRWVEGGNA